MVQSQHEQRCQLLLMVSADRVSKDAINAALECGGVACVILYAGKMDEPQFEKYCKQAVEAIQRHDISVLVADDTQAFGRSGADGFFLSKNRTQLADVLSRFSPQKIVGCGGIKDRHAALQVGEENPDFVFFGKLDGDIKPEPHPKNVQLAQWWAELVEIPTVLMGGNDLASVEECVKTGAEFVALGRAVFECPQGIELAIEQVQTLILEHAPILNEE